MGASALSPVTTVPQRKATEAARRRRAAEAVVRALGAYAAREGGAYVVYGSYVANALRFDSDLDILVDFPPDRAGAAWRFAEEACAAQRIPPDLHDAGTSRPAFVQRVRARGLRLP